MLKVNSSSRDKTRILLKLALDKQAQDPLVLDLREADSLWDYFIVVSSDSSVQARSIADHLRKKSRDYKFTVHHQERDEDSSWILLDYFDVLIHIFSEQKRSFYRIERLFKKAKKVKFRFDLTT